jgi:hypothetical protein
MIALASRWHAITIREIGLPYYVIASSRTLGEALQRLARYSKVTNEALVFGYQEGKPAHYQPELLRRSAALGQTSNGILHVGAIRICRLLTGQTLVPQHFSIAHYRSETPPKCRVLSERKYNSVLAQTSFP